MNNTQRILADITRREHEATKADIKTSGWKTALTASQQRLQHLSGLIASTASSKAACSAGCWYCCHLKVDARAEEVFQIAEHVQTRFSAQRQQQVRDKVTENARQLSAMTREQQFSANLPCAFLQDGQCSIYEVRPIRCRTFHATDVASCKQAWEEPSNLQIQSALVPELLYTGEAHIKGSRQAFADAGYDSTVYELNAAMAMALSDSTPKRRFEKHKRAFVGIGQN